MGRVSTNAVSVSYAQEDSIGVLPASPVWHLVECNDISTLGASISTVARNPISKDRQGRKGVITDLDSSVEIPIDVTMNAVDEFMPAFLFSKWKGATEYKGMIVTPAGYTVASGGALDEGTLIFVAGSIHPGNNGLKVVEAGSTATNIAVSGLTPEDPASIKILIAGVRCPADDIQINADKKIISTVTDFTTFGIAKGSYIFLGGKDVANRFASSTNAGVNYGYCRVLSVSTNEITIDKTGDTFVADAGTGKSIDIYYGKFSSNVSIDSPDFMEKSYQFEASYPNLADSGDPMYEYAKGNYANQITVDFPLTDKATMTLNFVGTDTEPPTAIRAGGTWKSPYRRNAINTSTDFARMRLVGDSASGLNIYVKSLNLTINNNVSPEKVLGRIGALFVNLGDLEITASMEVLFTSDKIIKAIRDNATLTMDIAISNDDGAVVFDIPSLTVGNGAKTLTANETVKLAIDGTAFGDAVLDTSLGITSLAYVPGDF